MAVKVHDRDGKEWIYERGAATQLDDMCLAILDESGYRIGAFNAPSWTHFSIPKSEPSPTTINVGSVDEAITAQQTLANKKQLGYTSRG